jgi:RES domain-containing protein
MHLFRIARTARIRDLSGTGAKVYGGRWNRKGIPVIYCSESRALATVEFLVHVPIALAPARYSMATLVVPDDSTCEEIPVPSLPRNWRAFPAPERLSGLGSEWAVRCASLILRVPSAVVESEYNVLINPSHRGISKVRIVEVETYRFDPRLFRPRGNA